MHDCLGPGLPVGSRAPPTPSSSDGRSSKPGPGQGAPGRRGAASEGTDPGVSVAPAPAVRRGVVAAERRGTTVTTPSIAAALIAAPRPCRARRGPCRAPCRSPSTPAPARAVGHVDLLDPPAGGRRPQHHLQRPAEAAVADAQVQQGLSASGAHRPEVAQRARPMRRRSSSASTRLATRACTARRRARAGGRPATGPLDRPATGPATRRQLGAGRASRRSP